MIFTLEAVRAKHGDSLLLHYGDPDRPRLALIDGGPSGVYRRFLKPVLAGLRDERGGGALPLELVMVSHIDDDHIRGLLDLTQELVDQQAGGEEPEVDVRTLWHNSFDDVVGSGAERLETAGRRAGITTASTGDAVSTAELRQHPGALVLASVKQGRALRDRARTLGLAVNRGDGRPLVSTGGPGDLFDLGDGLTLRLVAPLAEQVARFQEEWDREIERLGVAEPAAVRTAAYLDDSAFNLASLVVVAKAEGGDGRTRRMLLTGDARGDHTLLGLRQAGLLDDAGTVHFDLLKLPHHGSDRNVETDFFRQVTADHYVVSGDGGHGNPEVATFEMLFTARPDAPFHLHLTYPPEELRGDYPVAELQALLERRRQQVPGFQVHTPADGEPSLRIEL
ncbi:MAG TPA: MBL fold metallo-hydrolase [Thermoanaerobaculia bacterium]|nr:MBL fold metallo-hydrolase [Thermoanaerobaculia bacterium]